MESAGQVMLGTVIGFALLAGFVMMLYVAFKALWIAGRMGASVRRTTKRAEPPCDREPQVKRIRHN